MSHRLRLLLIDPVPLLRIGYISILSKRFEIESITEMARLEDADASGNDRHYDLIVSEISESGGVDPISRILRRHHTTKAIICTMAPPHEFVRRALRAGARAFVHKSEPGSALTLAARAVMAGQTYISDTIAHQSVAQEPVSLEALSDRELSVYTLVGKGHTTKEIAGRLNISIRTVETHRRRTKQKLGLDTTGDFVRHAIAWVANLPSRTSGSTSSELE